MRGRRIAGERLRPVSTQRSSLGPRAPRRARSGSGRDWSKVTSAVTSLTAIGALLFTALSLQQTRAQNQLAESGQITDRFNAAVTNLGSATMTIRIGGIYALQRIMQDSARDQPAALQVLAAFVRQRAALPSGHSYLVSGPADQRLPTPGSAQSPDIDVQTALTVLAGRDPSHDQGASIDLSGTDLEGANLSGAALAGASLVGADLAHAYLGHADLQDAELSDTVLVDSGLSAFLQGADLSGANLTAATLDQADLADADLTGTDLYEVDLSGVNLTGAEINGAEVSDPSWCEDGQTIQPGGYICVPLRLATVSPSPSPSPSSPSSPVSPSPLSSVSPSVVPSPSLTDH